MPSTVSIDRSLLREIVRIASFSVSRNTDRAVGERSHVGLVRNHDDGDALVAIECGEQVHDVAAGRRVEVAGRLVGEQYLRAGNDRPRDRDALLLAAR
jgi:hypothetical protein